MTSERDDKEKKPEPGRETDKRLPKVEPSEWQPDAVIDPVPAGPTDVPGPVPQGDETRRGK